MLVSFTVERARHDAEMQRLALTDQLTGLNNQRALVDAAERELARATRHTKSVSLLAIHLDQFADLHRQGRQVSEEALRTVARLLHQTCRTEDVAGRRDGGEYMLVLPETAKVGALLVAERIRADLARLAQPLGQLSISIGVASLPDDGRTLPDLLSAADEAMYRALRRGGNEVVAATRRSPGQR
jgi:diguanylate cyclase (GGDEF)-like protein